VKKLRNMAANELQTQLEYDAIALSVNDFVIGSIATARKSLDEPAADAKKL